MEAIEKIELARNLVANATRRALGIKLFIDLNARIQSPRGIGVMAVGQAAQVIVQTDIDVQTTDDSGSQLVRCCLPSGENLQSRGLEEIVILFKESRLFFIVALCRGEREAVALINLEQNVGDIIVETTIHDQHDIDARWLSNQTSFAERVGFEQAALQCPNFQLVFQIGTIEWSKIQVRRGVRNVCIQSIGSENIYEQLAEPMSIRESYLPWMIMVAW